MNAESSSSVPAAPTAGPPKRGWKRRLEGVGPIEWLCLFAGGYLVLQYGWLLDDAFVYFRYADNWVQLGRGLVYNPGEFAEGYTSPGWMLLLSALRTTKAPFWLLIQLLAVTSFLLTWLLARRTNRAFSPSGSVPLNLPLAFLAFNYGFLCYYSSGTESPLVQLAGAAYVLFVLRPDSKWLAILVASLPMIRPELGLAMVGAILWSWLRTRRLPWLLIGAAASINGSWMLFRVYYYADLFPTTFYLKNLTDISQGLRYLHDSFSPYHLYEGLALASLGLALGCWRWGRNGWKLEARGFLVLIAALQIVYTVKVGGDARHYRYLAFPVVVLVLSLGGIAERWIAELGSSTRARWAGIALALLLAGFSLSLWPRQLTAHPLLSPDSQPRRVARITDAAHHRQHRFIAVPKPWTLGLNIEQQHRYDEWLRQGAQDPPRQIMRHELCYNHYLRFDGWAIHSYGLTDPLLARMTVPMSRPAHKDSLRHRAKEIQKVMEWWGRPPAVGMYRAALEAGIGEPWMRANLSVLELVEKKAYNRHDLIENLGLALHFRERIDPKR